MKPISTKKKIGAGALAVATLAGAGIAFAFYNSNGSGNGVQGVGSASKLSITQLGTVPIYDSTLDPMPANGWSIGAEAYAFNQLGNKVNLATTSGKLSNVVVTMNSWACETGSWTTTCSTTPGHTYAVPITFNIYRPSDVVNPIASDTETFNIPFRPSSDAVNCAATPSKWFDSRTQTCNNGFNTNIAFHNFGAHVVLPDQVVYGISYNTNNYGPSPIPGSGNPADSLNVALTNGASDVSVGSDADPGKLFVNVGAPSSDLTCDSLTQGVFQEYNVATDCGLGSTANIPAVQFNAVQSGAPANLVYPGGSSQPVDFTVTNPGRSRVELHDVTFSVASVSNQHASSGPACDPAWFQLTQPGPVNVTLLPGQTLPVAPSGGSIALQYDPSVNQDACQGATANLAFTSD